MERPKIQFEIVEDVEKTKKLRPTGIKLPVGWTFDLIISPGTEEIEEFTMFLCQDQKTIIRCIEKIFLSANPTKINFTGVGQIGDMIDMYLFKKGNLIEKIYPNPLNGPDHYIPDKEAPKRGFVEIRTIKNLNPAGKWMEFWFEEGPMFNHNDSRFHQCCKSGEFWQVLNNLPVNITEKGIVGLKTRWIYADFNWNFDGFEYEKPITIEEAEKLLGRKIIVP